MSSLVSFSFGESAVRTSVDGEGAVWFCARDVADILGYSETSKMLRNVSEEDVNLLSSLTSPSAGDVNNIRDLHPSVKFVNESGLYAAVLASEKEEAKAFKRWVTSEVLPSIRKTGSYQKQVVSSNPQIAFMQLTVNQLAEHEARLQQQQQQLQSQGNAVSLINTRVTRQEQDQRLTASQVAELDKALSEKMKQNGNPKFIGVLKKQLKAKFLEAPVSSKTIKDIASKDFPDVIEYIKKYHW